MLIFNLATLLISVTSVLTSPVTEIPKAKGNLPPGLEGLFETLPTDIKNSSTPTDTRSVPNNESTISSKGESNQLIITEGGSIGNLSGIMPKTVTVSSMKGAGIGAGSLLPEQNLTVNSHPTIPQSDNNREVSSIVGRKGATRSNVSPRKGVSELSDTEKLESSLNSAADVNIALKDISNVRTKSTVPPIENGQKSIENNTKYDDKFNITGNETVHIPYILVPAHPNVTIKHKPKPTLTTGEDGNDDDKGLPSSPTQTQIGMPKKIDYIIPVVITIMAAPVLGIAAYILYTRGRDCWDKRHYRRMDFLIDGMYND